MLSKYVRDDVVEHGGQRLFVSQFVPHGFDPSLVRTRLRPGSPLEELLEDLPLPADRVLEEVGRARQELEETPGRWNGRHLALRNVSISRSGDLEDPGLDLVFEESDHASFVAVKRLWVAHHGRQSLEGVLEGDELRRVQPGLSHSFGLNGTVETADGMLVVTRRSSFTSSFANHLHTSVNEGMSPQDGGSGGGPDPYRTLLRGLHEELGVECGRGALVLHTLMLDVDHYEWGMLGHVDLRDTSWTWQALLARRALGGANDSWETSSLQAVPFTVEGLQQLLRREEQWIPHGRLNVVLSGVHRFPHAAAELIELL